MKPSLLLLALTAAAHAGEPAAPAPQITPARESTGWEFTTALYAPLMGLEGDVGVAGLAPNHVDVPFDEILDNLDAGLSGAFEAKKDRWSITVDAIWLKLSASANPIASSYFRFSQDQIMASASVGYEVYGDENTTIDLLGGVALNSIDVDLDLLTPNLPVTSRSRSGSQEWLDPFVGVRFHQRLGERWSIFANGLYGGFDVSSDEYWQAGVGIGYRLTEQTSLALAYRVIAVDYHQGGFVYDAETSGPNVGLIIRF